MLGVSRVFIFGAILLVAGMVPFAEGAEDRWADFRFLIGSWVGDGPREQGSGSFSLEPDLQGKVLVRRNTADLPAAPGRAPARHEDLMVIYAERGGNEYRASYFDSEGHVIQYTVTSLPDNRGLVFLSVAQPNAPRFRLTYTKQSAGTVAIDFEIAPPGQPDHFRRYLTGTAKRKRPEN